MSEQPQKAPENEQQICVRCGFCCDGTLFQHACLNPGERGHLPEKIEESSFTEEGKDYFRLPCNYFDAKCIIYESKRADVCSSYRCQLLKDVAEGRMEQQDAAAIVRRAVIMRAELMQLYRDISGNTANINFNQLLHELGKKQKAGMEAGMLKTEYEVLLARCNIFEALLIKHIRSASDFEKMIGDTIAE